MPGHGSETGRPAVRPGLPGSPALYRRNDARPGQAARDERGRR